MSMLKQRAKDRHAVVSHDELILKEQARVSEIMNLPESKTNWAAAATLATSSAIGTAEARSILALMPEGTDHEQLAQSQFDAMLQTVETGIDDAGDDYGAGQQAVRQFLKGVSNE